MQRITIICLLIILSSCSSDNIEYEYPQDPSIVRNSRAGRFFDDIVLFDGKDKKGSKSNFQSDQNKKNILWAASFEVVSSLFPIAIADSSFGIVVTDWYQDENNKESRVKINVLVKGKDIKEENLAVSIFRQKKDDKEQWQDQQADNSNLSARLLIDKIIGKARMLKN